MKSEEAMEYSHFFFEKKEFPFAGRDDGRRDRTDVADGPCYPASTMPRQTANRNRVPASPDCAFR